MKKLTLILLSVLMIVTLASCGNKCEHAYDNACDATCNECGETREVSAHDYYDANCTSPKTCKICGAKDGEALGHTWTDATCTTPKTCSVCGATEGEALGHKPEADDGDCTTEIKCGVCGEVTTAGKTEHIAHADDSNCTTPVTCTACETVLVAAKTHDFSGDWLTDATQHWHVCKNDGCTVTDTKTNHNEGTDGKCTECGYVVTVIPPHEHSYTDVKFDENNHWLECTCGAKKPDSEVPHTAEDDHDCTTADVCSCGHIVRAAKDHVAGNDDGNCTTAIPCQNCDQSAVAGNTKHTPEADDGDCTTAVKCAHCEQIAIEVQSGHTPGEDDGDCTTALTCKTCGTVTTEARANHEASEDDGNCLTAITCKNCPEILTAARSEHNFTGKWEQAADGHYHICQNDGCTVEDTKVGHSGGTATCLVGKLCTDCGYEYDTTKNSDVHAVYDEIAGKCECGEAIAPQATINDFYCETFDVALANWTDGTTLTLLADVTGLTEYFEVYAKGLILDLNGHKIECSDNWTIWIDGDSGSELTIRDSKGDGYIQGEVYAVTGGSTLRLESGTVESVYANGNFTMTGGKIICEDNSALCVDNYDVDVVISGGEISGEDGIWVTNADSITVTGNAKITATNGYAIYSGNVNETIIDGTPTLSGTKAEFSTYKGIVFNTLPADGTVWRAAINTKYNKNGIFAVPGEGITLDMGKFASAMDGYDVRQNAKGELLLCNHQTAYEAVSNEDGSTHKMLCCCGEITVEASISCSGFGATCQDKAVCDLCGQSYGETNPNAHTFNDDDKCVCGAERGEAINIDLSTLTETYIINDNGVYIFTGTGSYGIKVESGNPKIVLNNASISLTDGDYYDSNPINGIHIASTSGTTDIYVMGENSITAKAGAGIFVAEGGTVKITGSSREDILIATGASGCSGIGGYVYYTNGYVGCVNCGNIEISNVTVKAFGSQSGMGDVAPAIGGAGNANCGYITIDNADVYAEGFISPYGYGGSSAIGTGADFIYYEGGTIGEISIINDSNVYVTRGNYCDYIGCTGYEMAPADGVVNAKVDDTSAVIKQN